jgi:hypothetical protein
MTTLDLDTLTKAVAGGAATIRAISKPDPAGGPGDKVFPSTYVKERNAETKTPSSATARSTANRSATRPSARR